MTSISPLSGRTAIRARAIFIGENIDISALEKAGTLAVSPLTIRAGDRGVAVLFRYGAVVLIDLSPVEEASFLSHLSPLVKDPFERPETEEAELHADRVSSERDGNGIITLASLDVERLQIVADILARTVVLAHYEAQVAVAFDHIEPLARSLQTRAAFGYREKGLLRHIGSTLLIEHKMVGRVGVEEKPELLWDRPELDRMYAKLVIEYELEDRHRVLERKLELITRTAETLLKLTQDQRVLRVEWYVVVLILIEILLTIIPMIVKRSW